MTNAYCPDRWKFLGKLSQLDGWAISHTRSTIAIVRQLNQAVGSELGISWHVGSNRELDPGDSAVGALYDPISAELDEQVYIDAWVYVGNNKCTWTADNWRRFKHSVADTICHEHIHATQINDDVPHHHPSGEKNKTYLSNPTEIDAYAHNVAAEMYDHWDVHAESELDDWQRSAGMAPPESPSINLWAYANEFGANDPVVVDLVNRAKKYLVEIKKQHKTFLADSTK